MNLRQDVSRLVLHAGELGHGEDVVGLAAAFLVRVVDEDRVRLIPDATRGGSRVRCLDFGTAPHERKALVALDSGVIIGTRESETISSPDNDTTAPLLSCEEAGKHYLNVFRTSRGPESDVEGFKAIIDKFAGMGAFDIVGGLAAKRAIEESAVEIKDDENPSRAIEDGGRT